LQFNSYIDIVSSHIKFIIAMFTPLVCNKNNTTGTTCGAGTAYFSEAPDFTH